MRSSLAAASTAVMSIILGILGSRNAITKQILQDEILNPILDDLEKPPTNVIAPSEPLSSTFIECWATRSNIPIQMVKSDWVKNGRRAGVLRDAQIEKECNTFLIFEGPKSRYYLDLAERIAKKRSSSKVYVVHANSVSPVLLEVEQAKHDIDPEVEKEILTLPSMWKQTKCLLTDD